MFFVHFIFVFAPEFYIYVVQSEVFILLGFLRFVPLVAIPVRES